MRLGVFMRADFVMSISHSVNFVIKKISVAKVSANPTRRSLETAMVVIAVQHIDVAVTVVRPHDNHFIVVCLTVTFRP